MPQVAACRVQDRAVGGVVVHDEQAQPVELHVAGRFGTAARGRARERDGRTRTAAAARAGLDADLAAHQLDELLRDREAETGAAVVARGRGVRLREGLEQAVEAALTDSDAGVAHLEADHVPVALALE